MKTLTSTITKDDRLTDRKEIQLHLCTPLLLCILARLQERQEKEKEQSQRELTMIVGYHSHTGSFFSSFSMCTSDVPSQQQSYHVARDRLCTALQYQLAVDTVQQKVSYKVNFSGTAYARVPCMQPNSPVDYLDSGIRAAA